MLGSSQYMVWFDYHQKTTSATEREQKITLLHICVRNKIEQRIIRGLLQSHSQQQQKLKIVNLGGDFKE